jgi:hypothetical protein
MHPNEANSLGPYRKYPKITWALSLVMLFSCAIVWEFFLQFQSKANLDSCWNKSGFYLQLQCPEIQFATVLLVFRGGFVIPQRLVDKMFAFTYVAPIWNGRISIRGNFLIHATLYFRNPQLVIQRTNWNKRDFTQSFQNKHVNLMDWGSYWLSFICQDCLLSFRHMSPIFYRDKYINLFAKDKYKFLVNIE